MFFAISVSGVLMYENKVVEWGQRQRIAERLSLQADPSVESLLNIAATNFNNQFLDENFYQFNSELPNKLIKDSLISENFSGYLNKYDTRIYTYDSLFHPLFNDDSTRYSTIRTIIITHGKPTGIAGLYGYENEGEQSSYLYDRVIRKDSSVVGYFFVIVKPKKYLTEALYPELFKQTQDLSADLNTGYAYAVYSNEKLINHFNDYSFPGQINMNQIGRGRYENREVNGYDELWYNANNGKQVVIVKQDKRWVEFISLFAYLFCSFLIVVLLFRVLSFVLQARFKWTSLRKLFRLNIRSQIHSIIIFSSLFSFIVIGVATISFFMVRFNKNNEDRLLKSIQMIAEEIENKVRTQLVGQSGLNVNDIGSSSDFEKAIIEISETHNVDINYFDISGNLEISTQPYIYNKHLLSDKMEPAAYYELYNNRKTRFIQSEKIGTLPFLSIYMPIVDEQGNIYAYLNIPYLNSQVELNQEISGFLATLINLNSFIFLIAGAIAFLITSRITSSFSLIGDKMREISLGKVNEVIVWDGNDEIGVLVNEYNKMVKKLEESAKALAQSEREGAWREMARQIAHEIKNPLTPMKLGIQYLQKSVDSDAPNVKQLSQHIAATLVEQIDQLSKIAGDFSQFANINNVKLERFDISEVLASLVNLYQSDSVLIKWEKEKADYVVLADRTQMNRLFTNLLKNALEAAEERSMAIIQIDQKINGNHLVISLTDNGNGIPADIQQKIFVPNFTTKSSGTGLGLAICRGIVEKANGHISFSTKEGQGTVFIIELPLAVSE
jgi:signal transduction histidine kinase